MFSDINARPFGSTNDPKQGLEGTPRKVSRKESGLLNPSTKNQEPSGIKMSNLTNSTLPSMQSGLRPEPKAKEAEPKPAVSKEKKQTGPAVKQGGTITGGAIKTKVVAEVANRKKEIIKQDEREGPETHKFEVTTTLVEKFIDRYCSYIKIVSKHPISDTEFDEFINFFSFLFQSDKQRQQKLQQLKDVKTRPTLLNFDYFNNLAQDQKKNVTLFFAQIIKKFVEDNRYISITSVLSFVYLHLKINEKKYIKNGKFDTDIIIKESTSKESGDCKIDIDTHFFKSILKDLEFYKTTTLKFYDKIFRDIRKENDKQGNNPIFDRLEKRKNFSEKIWTSLKEVLSKEPLHNKQRRDTEYAAQINTLLKGMNWAYSLDKSFFTKKIVQEDIIPKINHHISSFEISKDIQIEEIDQLFLKMLTEHPFNNQQWDTSIINMINTNENRYQYLRQLTKKPLNYDCLEPLTTKQSPLFLEKLLLKDRQMSTSKDSFVFNTICKYFEQIDGDIEGYKKKHKEIFKYIRTIQQMLEQQGNIFKDDNKLLAVCKYAKLINSLSIQRRHSESRRIQDAIQLNPDKYIHYILINNVVQILKSRRQDFLSFDQMLKKQYRMSIDVVYQFTFRLIIKDIEFFDDKLDIVVNYYRNLDDFYLDIFTNYLFDNADNQKSCDFAITALTKINQHPTYRPIGQSIIRELSRMDNIEIQVEDYNHISTKVSKLKFIIKNLFMIKSNYISMVKHLLSIFNLDQDMLRSSWIKAISNEFRTISEDMHPQNIPEYGELLVECMNYIDKNPNHLEKVEEHFNFRFINRYLTHVLNMKFQKKKVINKFMKTLDYYYIVVAVKLLKAMSNLYLREKQLKNINLVPQQIRRLIEIPNKNGSFQLQFIKEASSYSVALIIILLSQEFLSVPSLIIDYPFFKTEIYEALINFNNISNILQNEIDLNIYQLNNKQWDQNLNKHLHLKYDIIDQIYREPSYLGLQFLLSWSGFKLDIKKKRDFFEKIKQIPCQEGLEVNRIKSHFIYIYWKEVSKLFPRDDMSRHWNFVDHELKLIEQLLENIDEKKKIANKPIITKILENIYQFTNLLRKTSKQYYTKFLLNYHSLLFLEIVNRPQDQDSIPPVLSDNFYTTLFYFFNAKPYLIGQQYIRLVKNIHLHDKIFGFLNCTINIMYSKKYVQSCYEDKLLQLIQYGLSLLIDLCEEDSQEENQNSTANRNNRLQHALSRVEESQQSKLRKWLSQLFERLQKRPQKPAEPQTRELIISILVNGSLSKQQPSHTINFNHQYWMLYLNVIEIDVRFVSYILLELQNTFDRNPMFFMNSCNYIRKAVKTNELQKLLLVKDHNNSRSIFDVLNQILTRAITGERSYYVVWIIEILIEMVNNTKVKNDISVEILLNVRNLLCLNRAISSKFTDLFTAFSLTYGFVLNSKNSGSNKRGSIKLAQKLEFLAYTRLMTIIKFNKNYEKLRKSALHYSHDQLEAITRSENETMSFVLSSLPLLHKLCLRSDVHLTASSELEQKLMKFQLSFAKNMLQSGIKQLAEEQLHHLWGFTNGLDLIDELINIDLVSNLSTYLSHLVNCGNTVSFHTALDDSRVLEERGLDLLKLIEGIIQKLALYQKNRSKAEPILFHFNKYIYLGSIELSKDLLYLNSQSLSSNLNIDYNSITERLAYSIAILRRIADAFLKYYENNKNKNDSRFRIGYNSVNKQIEKVREIVSTKDDSLFSPNNGSENMSVTKSKTIKQYAS